jgi:hypothetical protein
MMRSFWTVLATAFVLAVIALSMAMNFSFGYSLGTSETNARLLGGLSVACDGLKALLPLFIAWQRLDGNRLAAAAGTILFLLLLAYGAASAIGFAAENRASLTGGRENLNATLDSAVAALQENEARLAALPPHRLEGVIEAEIAAKRLDRAYEATKACTQATLPASRDFCKSLELLRGELAAASEAKLLIAKSESLRAEISRLRSRGAGAEADPQSRAIALLTGISALDVRLALAWLLALTVEAISAFGLFVIVRRHRLAPTPTTETKEPQSAGAWRLTLSENDETAGRPLRLAKAE